jgi:hypothetical protein
MTVAQTFINKKLKEVAKLDTLKNCSYTLCCDELSRIKDVVVYMESTLMEAVDKAADKEERKAIDFAIQEARAIDDYLAWFSEGLSLKDGLDIAEYGDLLIWRMYELKSAFRRLLGREMPVLDDAVRVVYPMVEEWTKPHVDYDPSVPLRHPLVNS